MKFYIEDEIHAMRHGDVYESYQDALAELVRVSTFPWGEWPNSCPCGNLEGCSLEFHISQWDDEKGEEVSYDHIYTTSAKGIDWHIEKPKKDD